MWGGTIGGCGARGTGGCQPRPLSWLCIPGNLLEAGGWPEGRILKS